MELMTAIHVATSTGSRFDEDTALVEACKNGNVAAFEKLVERYDIRLFRIAQHITHNREDAQDAVQDAFLKAFRNLGQFHGNSRFSTWLTRIAINESLTKLRKQRSNKEVSFDDTGRGDENFGAFEVADWAANPEEVYAESELRSVLRSELQQLPDILRVVFVLRDIEGLSGEQTAEVLESTPVAIKARLWRARITLRDRLSKYLVVRTRMQPK
jgi:RNA polymerase sigma-70 factor, ECF subfamily